MLDLLSIFVVATRQNAECRAHHFLHLRIRLEWIRSARQEGEWLIGKGARQQLLAEQEVVW